MKNHTHLSPRQEAQAERQLAEALLSLQTPEEVRSFLTDLCTPNELQAMADRWAVVECLQQRLPYREIYRRTGVSLTTIGRVARYLSQGAGGYALAVARTGSRNHG
jgi:TrpR-related protein YerC/YecD